MKAKAMITMLVSVAMILTAPLVALGAKGAPGPPSDGGGGGEPPDYGDLIILYRDAYGVPIPSPVVAVTDPETFETVAGGLCWQPIAFNVVDQEACPAICVLEALDENGDPDASVAVVDVNQYSCGVEVGCSGCTQEVDFGRINDARSADTVFASQLADVVVNLATADCRSLDPAGRLVTSRVETGIDEIGEYSVVTSAAIDSPLQNLAIYKQLMKYGYLGDESNPISLPASALDTAARGLGAGSGKTGWVGVDLVAYLNQIMGLTDPATTTILDPKLCETYREEVKGVIQLVEKCFLDYTTIIPLATESYSYGRTRNFGALPDPPYIPENINTPGVFEYLVPLDTTPPTFGIKRGTIVRAVFDTAFRGSNIGGFAQAADDARAVINFMHSWAVPVDYQTPVTCEASNETRYDVSISDVSGLSVPVQMVDGGDGRDFVVTVANAGPDEASGTVTVTADAQNGVDIDGSPWTFDFTDVPLPAGGSRSWTQFFSINLGDRTTIDWEATVAAPKDVNSGNNTVTATTSVRVGGGGGQP